MKPGTPAISTPITAIPTPTVDASLTDRLTDNRDLTDVYRPQEDTWLLIEQLCLGGFASGARVADLCTGSGVIAYECAALGAQSVLAIDSCPTAVEAARERCDKAPCAVTVEHGDVSTLVGRGRFDLVTCNPPYVPALPLASADVLDPEMAPRHSWEAGTDGRRVLNTLCAITPHLLAPGGTLLVVQSEFANIDTTVESLRFSGLNVEIVATKSIPFGPVLRRQSAWLEARALLEPGRRTEKLAVIAAHRAESTDGARR
ncbi:methyltransferase [Gordonia otitidis]|uniref:Methyltransferase n=1 Tax=Gordonia otitidis (strain DSM 44809 / CCUG 52243 / JCM 12355 / NBRC 100426 / IFM 10032) TaxID=1108044 RepID=H5TLI4_GORO1|nr:methyltransferase [Gordonia otitidis]UEA57337.1 methyltransferase [Gordonia otitidis]GAB34342.1 putative methyltransferase [Gordonia otitidis NBRC 100426]